MGNLSKLSLVYDGECNLCLATVDKLKAMNVRADVTFVPLQSLLSGETAPWAGIEGVPPAELASQMHVTDEQGRRYSGSDGILFLLRHVPSLAWLGILGSLPGMRGISRSLYRLIARHRYRLFGRVSCADGACSLPRPTLVQPRDGGDSPDDQSH